MKKFYALFLALPVLALTLLYLSLWWFIGGVAVLMVFIAYQFYAARLKAMQARNEVLEKELEELHVRLEHAVLKEQKTSKEADQVRLMKQQLLSVLSHEIRTPMNGVMGMVLLLEDTPLSKEQQEYITTIRNCGESLLATVNNILVNDILDLSKLNQEGNQLEYKDFNLRDSIEEVLELFADKTGKANLDLLYYIDEDVPEQIVGDTNRLRQILMNLVENAVKFTNYGEVFVGLHYISHNSAGHPPQLKFEVRDTGIGIPTDQLNQLFKGIPGKESKHNGEADSGLGLVICKKLTELMGGTIEAKSEPGQGTTFTFTIPITPSLKSTRNHARTNDMIKLEGKRILIADDNQTSRTILMNQMKLWKMFPVPADSAKQALEILSKDTGIDVVLTDMNMPEMDGLQLAKSIKNQYPAIPSIGMKQQGDERYGQEPEVFASILNKPIRQHILRDHIVNIFSATNTAKQKTTNRISDVFAEQYPLRILIAEDNLINQKIATKILATLGYKPELANNGKEVMEMVSNQHYDIILMDVQMPEMDGLQATQMIRTCLEIQPVIIAVTANAMQGDRDACMQAGMDDYMSKPIELKELLSQLEKWYLAIRDKRKASA